MKRAIFFAVTAWLLASPVVLRAGVPGPPVYDFPPAESLADQPLMPDPFRKPDGTRVTTQAEWPAQGPEEFLAIFDYADEVFFGKPRGPSTYNVAPKSDTWRYDPAQYPLLIDWRPPAAR
jgi:hypothetical protein